MGMEPQEFNFTGLTSVETVRWSRISLKLRSDILWFLASLPHPPTQLLGNNEKALIVVGESWEWTHTKRMLVNVTEVSLRHMRRDVIANKFAANLSWIPNLKSLTLADNDLKTFADVVPLPSCLLDLPLSVTGPWGIEIFPC
jgi:hypothetical protein